MRNIAESMRTQACPTKRQLDPELFRTGIQDQLMLVLRSRERIGSQAKAPAPLDA
jgi:hypothetical protein